MYIEEISRICLNYLRNTYKGFPDKGFVAGGCLANLIWEFKSGNKAIINDIDIFVYKGEYHRQFPESPVLWEGNKSEKLNYLSSKTKLILDYHGITSSKIAKDYYKILYSKRDGIFNFIEYEASSNRPDLILESFDINCTQIGYSIEEDKFYWTNDFEEFIQTGSLKLSNILTPAHSAIRLVKKKFDLKCELDESEIELCKVAISRAYSDINKRVFTDKYGSIFEKYEVILSKHFTKKINEEVTKIFKENDSLPNIDIFELIPINTNIVLDKEEIYDVDRICFADTLLFWYRNIYKNPTNSVVWRNLQILFESKDYIDCQFNIKDIQILSRLLRFAPTSIENLKDLTLSKQIRLVNYLLDKFSYDPIIAICLLENKKIEYDIEVNDDDVLLLELSVRKQIVNNSDRANLIINGIDNPQLLNNDFNLF
jgi:hypothetical protein